MGTVSSVTRYCALVAAWVLGVAWTHAAAPDVPEWAAGLSVGERQLLEEYRAGYARLKDFYNNLRMDAVWRQTRTPDGGGGEVTTTTWLRYRSNAGKFYRMDVSNTEDGAGATPDRVAMVRPEGYVAASRSENDDSLVIHQWEADVARGVAKLASYLVPWSPYSADTLPLEWFAFQKPPFAQQHKIEKIALSQEGNETLATLTFRGTATSKGSEYAGKFVFFRDRSWALKEFAWGHAKPTQPTDEVRHGRYEYEGAVDGVPLLKRLDLWWEAGPQRRRSSRSHFEIQRIEAGPVPEEEFTMESLGLKVGQERSAWLNRLILLVSGVLLVSLYVVLKRRFQKRDTADGRAT